MKIINWILKALKWVKSTFELVKWILAILAIITSFGWVNSCSNKKNEIQDITTILTSKIDTFKTESGKNAIQVNQWQIKYKALEKINSEISHENNVYLKELAEASETIADLKLREKDVKTWIKNELISKDSIRTELVFLDCDNIEIKPIEKKHIKIDFIQEGKFLDVKYKYNANVNTVISRYPELKINGKKHFPNWGWLYGWDYKTTSIIDDPNAKIENIVSIEFDK